MDENPALALKDHIEGIDDVLSYTEFGTLTQVADDMLLSGLHYDSRIQIKGNTGNNHWYHRIRNEYIQWLVHFKRLEGISVPEYMKDYDGSQSVRLLQKLKVIEYVFIQKANSEIFPKIFGANRTKSAIAHINRLIHGMNTTVDDIKSMLDVLETEPRKGEPKRFPSHLLWTDYGWLRHHQYSFINSAGVDWLISNIIPNWEREKKKDTMREFYDLIEKTESLGEAIVATKSFVLNLFIDWYNQAFTAMKVEVGNKIHALKSEDRKEAEQRRLREIAKKQAELQREKKRKEKEAEEKKKQFLAEQRRKKEEADERERQRIAGIRDQHADLLASCRKNKISQEFIATLEKELKQSEFSCTWEQLLHDIWVPLGRPKQTEDWNAGLEWILSTIDWTGTAADAKLHITTKLENTVLPLQQAHADLITLLPGDQRTFQRLVALFSEQEFTNLDHQVLVGLLKKNDQAYTHLKQLAFQLLDIGTTDAKVNAIMTRLLEGEDEAFVLADEGVAFQT